LVPIGAYFGKGKRTGVYGAFLMACYDPDNEEYQTITKIGTGFSDEDLKALYDQLHPHEVAQPPKYYRLPDLSHASHAPDVYFRPVQVWEVQAADLSVSPKYLAACGLVDETKGIALRFPRYMRTRDDKKPEDATTSEQVADFYKRQTFASGGAGAGEDSDD
jgi:DNA ligase-1